MEAIKINYTRQDRLTLESFSKLIDGKSPRNYGNCLGYESGMLAYTDGFFMLLYHSNTFQGKGTLDKLFQETQIKYPNFKGVIPDKSNMKEIDGSPMVKLASVLKGKGIAELLIHIDLTEDVENVCLGIKKIKDMAINPFLLSKALKGLPKNTQLTKTYVNTEAAILEFNEGIYQIILVSMKKD